MGKVVLLNPPANQLVLRDQHCCSVSKADYYWPAVDLIMLSGILSQCYDVFVIDAIIDMHSEIECLGQLSKIEPDAVIFVTGISSWVGDFAFMEKVKQKLNCTVIASGGFLLSTYRENMEKFPFLDGILMDYTSFAINDFLAGKKDVYDICFRDGDNIMLLPSPEVKREFCVPVPRHDLFPLAKYCLPHAEKHPFSSVLTNYGCPFSCNYCIAEGSCFKYRPVENVIPELEFLISLGVKEVFFKDFTFGIPHQIALNLCSEMTRLTPKLSWICSSRVDVLDEELLLLMKKAGCHTIQFGVESASQVLLDANEKRITTDQIEKMFMMCEKLKIKTLAHFVLGLPGETEKSIHDTLKFAQRIKCDYASFNVAIPLPGTSLRQRCIENGWLVSDQEELDSSRGYPVIETPNLSREKLWELRNQTLKSFYLQPSFIFRKLRNIRSINDLLALCKQGISLLGTIKR